MIIDIKVTQSDIDTGKRISCRECPVARAITRVLDPLWEVDVDGMSAYLFDYTPSHAVVTRTLPYEARVFILGFDSGRKVEPFEFKLDIPDEILAGPQEQEHPCSSPNCCGQDMGGEG